MPGGTGGSTEVMQLGGAAPGTGPGSETAVNTTETLDEASAGSGWAATPSMNVGRGHHNTVLLPDGSMVTVGGGVGARGGDQWVGDPEQRQVELWNPLTGNWTLGPSQAENTRLPLNRAAAPGRPRDLRRRRRQRRPRRGRHQDGHRRDLRAALPLQGPAPHHQLGASHASGWATASASTRPTPTSPEPRWWRPAPRPTPTT